MADDAHLGNSRSADQWGDKPYLLKALSITLTKIDSSCIVDKYKVNKIFTAPSAVMNADALLGPVARALRRLAT